MRQNISHKILGVFMAFALCFSLIGAQALHSLVAFANPSGEITVGGVLYGGLNAPPKAWDNLNFAGGDITPETAPQKEGYQFVSAFIPNPNDASDVLYITSAKKTEAGDAIEITTREPQPSDKAKLLVPISESAQKIKFLYSKEAEWASVTYVNNTQGNKGIVTGPGELQIVDGKAKGYFTVSVPRKEKPSTPALTEGAEVKLHKDLSTPERTVYQYELTITKDTTVTVGSEALKDLHATARNSNNNDWKAGFPAGKFADKEIVLPENTTYQPGGSLTFNVYHDRVISSQVTYSSFLAALRVNGQVFGVPQPFGRYPQSKYDINPDIQRPELYSRRSQGSKSSWELQKWLVNAPWATPSFSAFQGYDPYWHPDQWDNNGMGNRAWWRDQVAKKVIGQETAQYVDAGPLAGATIKIKILDAIPYMQTRELGEYAPGQEANTNTYTRGAMNNRGTGAEKPAKNNGYGMSLRMAYQITIENIPNDMEIGTEWAASNNFKIGPYLNYGVENVEVKTAAIGYISQPNPSAVQWRDINSGNDPGWIDGAAVPGTGMNPKDQGHSNFRVLNNKNSHLEIRGNVLNGYVSPYYVDASEAPLQKGKPNMSLNNTAEDGKGWKGKFPTFAVDFDWITDMDWGRWNENPVNCYGGMNIIGVRTHLMKVPVGYDLRGATVPAGQDSEFPTVEAASANTPEAEPMKANVESNPIIQVPNTQLTKNDGTTDQPLLFYDLYRQTDKGLVNSGKSYLPGSSIDVRDAAQTGGRLSDISGNALVKALVLKPVFAGDLDTSENTYRIERNFIKDGILQNKKPQVAACVMGVSGIQAEFNADVAPASMDYEGLTYKLKNPMKSLRVDLKDNKVLYTLTYEYTEPTYADTFDPKTKAITTDLGVVPDEETLMDHIRGTIISKEQDPDNPDKQISVSKEDQPLPEGSHVFFADDKFDEDKPGEQDVKLRIIYPDGSEQDVMIKINVVDDRTDAEKWADNNKTQELTANPTTLNWGTPVTPEVIQNMVQQSTNLPEDVEYSIDPALNTSPNNTTDNNQETTVTVTFPDKSTMKVKVPVTIKTAADSFPPKTKEDLPLAKGQALTNEDAKSAIENADSMPEGTQFSFVNPVDTNKPGKQDAQIKIQYPDGTEKIVTVPVEVVSQADKWAKDHNGLKGQEKNFVYGSAVTDDDLYGLVQDGETLKSQVTSISGDPAINTSPESEIGRTQPVAITVTFKDGSSLTTKKDDHGTAIIDPAANNYKVTADKLDINIFNQPTEDQLKDALKVADGKSLPAGTTVAIKGGKVDADSAGEHDATIVVTYPDGSTTEVPVKVDVTDNRDSAKYKPEVQAQNAGYGTSVPDLVNAITNKDSFPKGTEIVPNTSGLDMTKPGTQDAEVTINYPDGSSTTVKVPVVIASAADTFHPEGTKTPVEVPMGKTPGDTDAKAAIADADSLPAGTKFSFVNPVDTSASGTVPAQVKIEYPDGSEKIVDVNVNVVSESEKWVREHGALEGMDKDIKYGSTITTDDLLGMLKDGESLKDQISSIKAEPALNTSPTSAGAHDQAVAITVTFKDGSTLTTTPDHLAHAKVSDLSDEYKVTADKLDINIFNQPTEDQLKDALKVADGKSLPAGTTVAIKGGKVDADSAGEHDATIVVTYPDGSTTEVPVKVDVTDNRDSAKYKPEVQAQNAGYGTSVPDLVNAITNKDSFPKGTEIVPNTSGLDMTKPGTQDAEVTINYPDGSSTTVKVPVVIASAADTFHPEGTKTPIEVPMGKTPGDTDAKAAIADADSLPAGTKFSFVNPVDTSASGTVPAQVKIEYPDGSEKIVDVNVNVVSESEKWVREHGALEGMDKDIKYGSTITTDDLLGMLKDGESLKDQISSIKAEPALNTSPTSAAGRNQDVAITVTFKDGSTLTTKPGSPAGIVVEPASNAFELSERPFDVNIFNEPTQDQIANALVDNSGMALPAGTKVELVNKPDVSVPGKVKVLYRVSFPDGSTKEIEGTINVVDNRDSAKYEPVVEKDITLPYGSANPDLADAIQNANSFPEGTKIEVTSDPIDTTKPGVQVGTVVVTYPDGSKDTVQVPVDVKTASDSFKPAPSKDVVFNFDQPLTDADAKELLDAAGLPAGTEFHLKAPVDTNVSGRQEAVIVVTYPDGTTQEITVPVDVRNQSQTWLNKTDQTNKSYVKGIELPWAAKVDKKTLESMINGASELPGGVIIATEPNIDTMPVTVEGHVQKVLVSLRFPDGSVLKQEVEVRIGPKPQEPAPAPAPGYAGGAGAADGSGVAQNGEASSLASTGDNTGALAGVAALAVVALGGVLVARRRLG